MASRSEGLDDDQAQQMTAEMWDAYCGEIDRQMRDFAAGLRPACATAILSNSADGARREEQRRLGFEELVDVRVEAARAGGWHAVLHRDATRSIQEISNIIRDACSQTS